MSVTWNTRWTFALSFWFDVKGLCTKPQVTRFTIDDDGIAHVDDLPEVNVLKGQIDTTLVRRCASPPQLFLRWFDPDKVTA